MRLRYFLSRSAALCAQQEYADAEESLQQAHALATGSSSLTSEVDLVRGKCELSRGEIGDAEKSLESVVVSTKDDFTRMSALMSLGLCALRHQDFEVAIDRYRKAESLSRELYAPFWEERAQGSQGFAYSEIGDFETAQKKSGPAETLAGKLGRAEDQARWALDLGREYDNTGRSGLAEENYRKALSLAREQRMNSIAFRALHNLVQIENYKGRLSEAEQLHSESELLKPTGLDFADYQRDEAAIAAAKHEYTRSEQILEALLPEVQTAPRRKWALEAELARVYAAEGNGTAADNWFRSSIDTMTAAVAQMKRLEFRIAMLNNWTIFDDYIGFLDSQNQQERALQVAQLARARSLAEELGFRPDKTDQRLWLRRIQAMLRARHSVLMAFYEAERETYVWLVTGKDLQMLKVGASQNEIETLADAYRAEIDQHATIDSSPAQQKLYQLLIKPVTKFIPHGSHVILVADSALYRINFETLICDEGQPHYWIDDVEIENASSIDLLLNGKHELRHGKGALVIGAPAPADPQYPVLPHADDEVQQVKGQFADGTAMVFESSSATPDSYLKNNPSGYKYIEFATHSDASSSDPMQSAIILSKDAAGAFRLTAKQIVEFKPRLNADLVTISGCYSGGKIGTSAEGLLGLQWAFQRAGAHQVVAGLWDVDDKSSPELMGGLYAGVVKGQSPARALRAAKLKMIHSGKFPPAPYYWAALQLYTGS